MTKGKLRELFLKYYVYWDSEWPKIPAAQLPSSLRADKKSELLPSQRVGHYKYLCLQGQILVDTDLEKAMHWLGFIQGVLWEINSFTLEDLMNQSREEKVAHGTTGAIITSDTKEANTTGREAGVQGQTGPGDCDPGRQC